MTKHINIVPNKMGLYYGLYREKMATGDVIEFRSETVVGYMIRKFTKQNVNHTALVIRLQQYDQDRVFILEAVPAGGVVLTKLSDRLENHHGQVYWLGLAGMYDGSRPAIGRSALNYVGVEYDFGNVFKQVAARVNADARRLFCSEFAYIALLNAGMPVRRKKAPQPGQMIDLGVYNNPKQIF